MSCSSRYTVLFIQHSNPYPGYQVAAVTLDITPTQGRANAQIAWFDPTKSVASSAEQVGEEIKLPSVAYFHASEPSAVCSADKVFPTDPTKSLVPSAERVGDVCTRSLVEYCHRSEPSVVLSACTVF